MSTDQKLDPRLAIPKGRVVVETMRTATVLGIDDKPSIKLKCVNEEIVIELLPRNSGNRKPVRLQDLRDALVKLEG